MNRDPVLEDTDRYYRERAEYERSLPVCACCGQPIMSDTACEVRGTFFSTSGEYFCEDCFTIWDTEDLIDG